MSIQEKLNKIRTAVYGKEVRQSIHDAIKQTYDDASEKDNANMEVKMARGTHANLNERLGEMEETDKSVAAQLDQKVGGEIKAELQNLSPTVLSAIDGSGGPFNLLSRPEDKSVTPHKTNFFDVSTNLFNKNESNKKEGYQLDSEGNEYANSEYSLYPYESIDPNTSYTVSHRNVVVSFFDGGMNYISRILTITEPQTFVTPENCRYVRLSVRYNHEDSLQLNKGSKLLPYEEHYSFLDAKYLPEPKEKPYERPTHYYFAPTDIPEGFVNEAGTYSHDDISSTEKLYAAYDSLIANNTNLSKTVYGKDTTENYDVWKITHTPPEFKPSKGWGSNTLENKYPKIIFVTGVHGGEKAPVLATYYFIKSLCEQWETNDKLTYLRNNVQLEFIPLAYPDGYNTGTYKNVTGVNIQTNFPHNWGGYSDPDSNVYGGTAPLSEKESTYIKRLIDDNKDAIFFADLHDWGGYKRDVFSEIDQFFYYVIAKEDGYNRDIEVSMKYSVESNSRLMKKNYAFDTSNFLGWIHSRDGIGTIDAYSSSVGISSFVMEFSKTMPNDNSLYNSDAIKASTELLGNTFLNVLRRFKDVY